MEIIDTIFKLVGLILFYGVLLVLAVLVLAMLSTVGFGAFVVYMLYKLKQHVLAATTSVELPAVPPVEAVTEIPDHYIVMNDVPVVIPVGHSEVEALATVWYEVAGDEFVAVRLVALDGGTDVLDSLTERELAGVELAARDSWKYINGQP